MERAPARPLHDLLFDLVAVLIALLLSFGLSFGEHAPLKSYGGLTTVVLMTVALSLIWRRRAPLLVAWIAAIAAAALPAIELAAPGTLLRPADEHALGHLLVWPSTGPFVAYGLMVFAAARPPWQRWTPVVVLATGAVLIRWVLPDVPPQEFAEAAGAPSGVAFRSAVFIAGGTLLGMYNATRLRMIRGLVERAERAERERHLLSERARAEERIRLATEMHDVVTHRVSLMVMQAGALRVTAKDEGIRTGVDNLRETGCKALEELRDVVGLLRRTPEWTEPEHVREVSELPLPDLRSLVGESEAVGVLVTVVEEGEPAPASPAVGRTAYRVVQEALTNVRKHAPGSRVTLRLRHSPGEVRLTVRNTAPAALVYSALAAAGSGTGLLGLRQRVELVGGTLAAGPDDEGGFYVDATLPTATPARRD